MSQICRTLQFASHDSAHLMSGKPRQCLNLSYRELDQRANQFAHCLRDCGLNSLDHYSVSMENNWQYIETNYAG
jgi:acyl-CoA synthetase (AMP-forming)/AMP-acid ligase II